MSVLFAMLFFHLEKPAPPITAVAFTPNGKAIVVGSQAGVEVLSWPDLKKDRALASELVNTHDLAFAPDGKTLAVGGGIPGKRGTVELFNWPDGKLRQRFSPHADLIYALTWRSDSVVFATASADNAVGIHDAATAKSLKRLEGHSRGVLAVAFLHGDSELVSAGIDESLRLWDAKKGEALRTLANHTRPVHAIAVRPGNIGKNPPQIVSVSDDRAVRLWQPTLGRMMRFARLESIPLAVAWTADGSTIVVACKDGRLRSIDYDSMDVVANLPALDVIAYCLAIAPDGSILIGGQNGQLKRIVLEPMKP